MNLSLDDGNYSMTNLFVAGEALAIGGFVTALILPLALIIPRRVQQQWRQQVGDSSAEGDPTIQPIVDFTPVERVIGIVVGALLCMTIVPPLGMNVTGLALGAYFLGLLVLAICNIKSLLLPDVIVLPMLWSGLLLHTWLGSANPYVFGAALGYLGPFLLNEVLKATRGKEFLGAGDLKTFSMAGAWLGFMALPTLFGAFLLTALVVGIIPQLRQNRSLFATGNYHLTASLFYVVFVAPGATVFAG